MNQKMVWLSGGRWLVWGVFLALSATGWSETENRIPQDGPIINPVGEGGEGGLGEHLRAKKPRPKAVKKYPYAPIKKQDDQAQVQEIEMYVGESRVFPAPGVSRIAVGNGKIMSAAALDQKEVIVFANGAGTSSLFVWSEDGRYQRVKINIIPGDTTRFAREIAAFLSGIPHAKASVIGDKVIVEGDNLSDVDLSKIEELSKRYPQIVNFTNRLGWEKMVLMDVKVVEFPKNLLQEIGIKWNVMGGGRHRRHLGPDQAHGLPVPDQHLNRAE